MNRIVRGDTEVNSQGIQRGDSSTDSTIESGPDRNLFKPFPWLAAATLIFALLYGSSYFALLWLPPYQRVDMTSQLHADYSPWASLVFQPVDPAVIEEIMLERGLPEQIIVDGSIWATPSTPLPVEQPSTSTAQPILDDATPGPSASETPFTETPAPTSIILPPQSTETPQPTAVTNPTKTRKPPKTHKPPKTEKPPKDN